MTRHAADPKIVAILNVNPAWSAFERQTADEICACLTGGLEEQGYTYHAFRYFDSLACLDPFDPREWLVWNFGEEWAGQAWTDAEVVEELERRGFAYTGSPPGVLRLTQSRRLVKERMIAAGLPTLPFSVLTDPSDAAAWRTYPAIVKGVHQHASLGIDRDAVVSTPDELAIRVEYLRRTFNDSALVEPFLDSREFQVAVWGNEHPEALPPSEVVFSTFSDMRDRLHTFQWKVDRDSRGYKEIRMPCPAPLDQPAWRARLEQIGLDTYRLFGLRDYARVDLRMQGDEPQVLDVNANPELDPESVVLAGARVRGLTYGGMVRRIIDYAAPRMPR